MRIRKLRAIAAAVVVGLVLAACAGDADVEPDTPDTADDDDADADADDDGDGDDDASAAGDGDLAGTSVTVFGPESSENEAGAVQDMLNTFAQANDMTISYTGARDFSDQIGAQADGGNPPDIAIFPQPGRVVDFGEQGFTLPIPSDLLDRINAQWPEGTNAAYEAGGETWGLQTKTDLKSILWFNNQIFADGGYEVPDTWDGLKDLTNQMIDDGVTPWCVGIESGPATGWVFTDWMEELVLRLEDEDVYDQWVVNEVGFSDERIVAIGQEILDLWNTPGAVFAAGGSIASTPFGDNGGPLVEGECAMHRQANFFAAFLPEGTAVGPDGDIDVAYFPAAGDGREPVLTAGTAVTAFRDAPEVWAVIEYMASAEGTTERQRAQAARVAIAEGDDPPPSGYLSANLEQDLSVYSDLERSFVEILQSASPARFDASDMMPGAVGAGTFWNEATSAVNGDKSIEEAFSAIDASWPN
jgi:alpha-glucoside transport system substrate-binding protein